MEIGIVGKPNVGKSTFFKAATMADAEIANYPFTTIKPNIGMGYVRKICACKKFNVVCQPKNSYCAERNRFIPVRMIDVAGLVPGAHEGKGLGNQFLDDLRVADVLIHVVDSSGRTDETGDATDNYDVLKDIKFLENEIDMWFFKIMKSGVEKVKNKIRCSTTDPIKEIAEQFSGLGISEFMLTEAARDAQIDIKDIWRLDDETLLKFTRITRKFSKPMIIAANKIDLGFSNFQKIKENYSDDYVVVGVCAEADLALRRASEAGIIKYIPGDPNFEITGGNDKQKEALNFIRDNILEKFGSSGVQQCINSAVFDILKYKAVYPVEDEHKLTDGKGNVLPDVHLVPPGATAIDLAYRVHTDIGDKFIGAINCETHRKVGRTYEIADDDVIKIIARK